MRTYNFKKLELPKEDNWLKRKFNTAHIKKTLLYSVIGGAVGFGLYFFSEGHELNHFWNEDAFQHIITGMFFGFFITNSPCARGKC